MTFEEFKDLIETKDSRFEVVQGIEYFLASFTCENGISSVICYWENEPAIRWKIGKFLVGKSTTTKIICDLNGMEESDFIKIILTQELI